MPSYFVHGLLTVSSSSPKDEKSFPRIRTRQPAALAARPSVSGRLPRWSNAAGGIPRSSTTLRNTPRVRLQGAERLGGVDVVEAPGEAERGDPGLGGEIGDRRQRGDEGAEAVEHGHESRRRADAPDHRNEQPRLAAAASGESRSPGRTEPTAGGPRRLGLAAEARQPGQVPPGLRRTAGERPPERLGHHQPRQRPVRVQGPVHIERDDGDPRERVRRAAAEEAPRVGPGARGFRRGSKTRGAPPAGRLFANDNLRAETFVEIENPPITTLSSFANSLTTT